LYNKIYSLISLLYVKLVSDMYDCQVVFILVNSTITLHNITQGKRKINNIYRIKIFEVGRIWIYLLVKDGQVVSQYMKVISMLWWFPAWIVNSSVQFWQRFNAERVVMIMVGSVQVSFRLLVLFKWLSESIERQAAVSWRKYFMHLVFMTIYNNKNTHITLAHWTVYN
jgi:hypothetical protein